MAQLKNETNFKIQINREWASFNVSAVNYCNFKTG